MLEADSIVANRQMRRRLGVWRIVAILAIALSLGILTLWGASTNGELSKFSDHIARVRVEGLITGDRKTLKMLDELVAYDDRVVEAIADAAQTVQWHHDKLLEAQSKGYPWGMLYDFREDLLAKLEDLE